MNKKIAMLTYLNFLESNLCFPLLGNLQKIAVSPEGIRHHIESFTKADILIRNEQKNLLPSKKFLWYLESEGILDQWLRTKAGSLFMSVLGNGVVSGHTKEGLIVAVDFEGATILWLDEHNNSTSVLHKKQLKKVWPVVRGNKIYLTKFEAKLYGFTKFE